MVSLRHPSTLPVVGVVADGQTYRHLLYLLLAIPLGFAYSAVFTVGLTVGLLLSVVLVGLVVLLALVLGARLIAGFERWLANRLLGTDLVAYDDVSSDAGGRLAVVTKYTDAASTWRGVGFLSLKFFVTVLAFVPIFGLASALPLVAAPFRYPYTASFGEVNGEPVTWGITTLPEALVGLSLGVVGVVAFLHVSNLIAYVARRMAVALLGDCAVSDSEVAVSDSGAVASNSEMAVSDSEAGVDSTGADSTEADSTAADSTVADSTAADSAAATEAVTAEGDHVSEGANTNSGSVAADNEDTAADAADEPSTGVASEDGKASERDFDGDRSAEDRFEYVVFDDEDGPDSADRDTDH